jgi:hypothetical protein
LTPIQGLLVHRIEPDHDVAQSGTEGRSFGATNSHDRPGANRLTRLGVRRDLLERLSSKDARSVSRRPRHSLEAATTAKE